MPKRPYDQTASRQLGLVTGNQLRGLGWTREQIRNAVRAGLLEPLRRSVFRTAGASRTREQAWLAAALAAPRSFLSHRTAAIPWAYLYVPPPSAIDLVRERNRPRLEGVLGHETDSLPLEHTAILRGLPVTSASRTLIDVCGLVSAKQLQAAANDGRRRGVLSLPALVRTVDEVPVSGRRAILPMAGYLETVVERYELGDSEPELDLVEALTSAGFVRPATQVVVETDLGTRYVDIGWPDRRVGFEYDSVAFHVDRFHEDRDRLRALKRAGWDIWPITKTTSRNEILAIATETFRHERAA